MTLPLGKVSPYELIDLIFSQLESKDERVLVGPDVGLDASIIDCGDKVIALSSDPITGSLTDPGWLSVHVNANDVATMGAEPRWFLMSVFLPEDSGVSAVSELVEGARMAAEDLGVSIVGGHTEVTPGLDRVLISGAMVGEAPSEKWVSAAMARPGDKVIFTKSAAIEGTYIIAMDREDELLTELDANAVRNARSFRNRLSVVKEALTAVKTGGVSAMHDPTEGGVLGGLHELSDASRVGFSINSEMIPVAKETRKICDYFNIDPLRTIGSGSLLICSYPRKGDLIVEKLREKGISASVIGEILEDEERRVMDGKLTEYPDQDELWKIF